MIDEFFTATGLLVACTLAISVSIVTLISFCVWFHHKRAKQKSTQVSKNTTVIYSAGGQTAIIVDDAANIQDLNRCSVMVDGDYDTVANVVSLVTSAPAPSASDNQATSSSDTPHLPPRVPSTSSHIADTPHLPSREPSTSSRTANVPHSPSREPSTSSRTANVPHLPSREPSTSSRTANVPHLPSREPSTSSRIADTPRLPSRLPSSSSGVACSPHLPPRVPSTSSGMAVQQKTEAHLAVPVDSNMLGVPPESPYDIIDGPDVFSTEGNGPKEKVSSSCESLQMPRYSPVQSLLDLITAELDPSNVLSKSHQRLTGYATLDGRKLHRRTSSLTDVKRFTFSSSDVNSGPSDRLPVYARVGKNRKKEERMRAFDELYSKVDKSKKKTVDDDAGNDDASTVDVCQVTGSTPVDETTADISDGGYELISRPPKGDNDYDTVSGGDFGYDSVDVVADQSPKERLPALATLRRGSEHIYDMVSENPSDLTDLKGFSSHAYEDIAEIPS